MPVSVLILLATCFITAPQKETNECNAEISFAEVNTIDSATMHQLSFIQSN